MYEEEDEAQAYLKRVSKNRNKFYSNLEKEENRSSSKQQNQNQNQVVSGGNNFNSSEPKQESTTATAASESTSSITPPPKAAATSSSSSSSSSSITSRAALLNLFNVKPPSLPRDCLPSPQFVSETLDAFQSQRNLLLETRSSFHILSQAQGEEEEEGEGEQEQVGGAAERSLLQNRKAARRNRQGKGGGEKQHQQEQQGDEEKSEMSQTQQQALFISRQILQNKVNETSFNQLVPKKKNEFYSDGAWDAFLRNSVRFFPSLSESRTPSADLLVEEILLNNNNRSNSFLFTPRADLSLLSRMTPGMAQALLGAATRRFCKLAASNNLVYVRYANYNSSSSSPSPFSLLLNNNSTCSTSLPLSSLEVSIDSNIIIVEQNEHVSSSASQNNNSKAQIDGMVRFLLSIKHLGVSCWLYTALASIELPLVPEKETQLQEVLKISCQTLKLLFEVRPDLKEHLNFSLHQNNKNNNNNNNNNDDENENTKKKDLLVVVKDVVPEKTREGGEEQDGKTAEEEEGKEKEGEKGKETSSSSAIPVGTSRSIQVTAQSVNCLGKEDVLSLVTIIIIVGKFFRRANPALLPL